MRIEEIDQNFSVPHSVPDTDLAYHTVREAPFALHGLYEPQRPGDFRRMPDAVARTVSPGVTELARHTAGGRVRFATDSDLIVLRAVIPVASRMPHMPSSGAGGFDLYVDDPDSGISRYYRTLMPSVDMAPGYEAAVRFPDRRMRNITIHFPLYAGVGDAWIGLREGAALSENALHYRSPLPIVYYGSSITQGGCASRPGNCYQNILSRRLHLDHINLGFSGSGRGEDTMIAYLASLPLCAFVSDYDHNAPDVAHLEKTHFRLYQAVRAAHPDVPYLMLSRCDFDSAYHENIRRREVVYATYRAARAAGDQQVYYIDGASVFRGPWEDMCTVDGVHPNDVGFALLADAIGAELQRAFTQATLA